MNKTINFNNEIPIVDEVDVVVVGGGPSGIGAAVAAGRAGATTAIIERYGFLGGNATAGGVGPFMTSFSDDGEIQLVKGVFDELIRRSEKLGGAIHPQQVRAGSSYSGYIKKGHDHVTPFNPEAIKVVAAEMMEEANINQYLHSFFLKPLIENNKVSGVIIVNKSGMQAIKARVTIDCSADGDVAYNAGVEMEYGRNSDNLTQPMTMFFRVAGVDDQAVEEYVQNHPEEMGNLFSSIVKKGKQTGEWNIKRDKVGIYRTNQRGVWRVNTSRIQGLNGTDFRDLSKAEIEGRKQVFALVQFFRKNLPGFQNAELIDTATQIGVRETRRIIGEYVLKAEDLVEGKAFKDVVALYGYPIDIHSPTDGSTEFSTNYQTANYYQLPYRILLPEKVDGLLVAGRCVSATHEALGAIRVMPCAFALGQAAGVGAALASSKGIEPRNVDIHLLQETLSEQDVVLPTDLSV